MSIAVPQEILDALTRVEMPKVPRAELSRETLAVDGHELTVYRSAVVVVGSGAAGLRAAVELKRHGEDVLVASTSPFGGTSACSGSDKQTLHTAGTNRVGDNFVKLAADLGAGGCMDLDNAYIEATGSINALAGLQFMGLPLPQDRFGAVLRYQTDHDEVGRATSCGPRTSRLMCKVLAEEALRLNVPFLPKIEAVRLLTSGSGDQRRIAGVLCIDLARRADGVDAFTVLVCDQVVLATGGPGELYRDSVYPRHCYGSLGMAIEAGVEVTNLTESQFGIGTRREAFPWNLSGTYVQVIPYVYSVDADGVEHNFLAEYYRTTRELACNVFRKGYQWPVHATRMCDFGSSLVDLAVYQQERMGRTCYLDFNRNPLTVGDSAAFSLDDLDDDVRNYLANNEALQDLPIDRLKQMNPLAIELYRMHGTDIETEPLPFAVNNQHMNGGVSVDAWFRSSLPGCYAVGEVAGSHGVTRPGGAALNAGQVAGIRVARHIHEQGRHGVTGLDGDAEAQIADALAMAKHSQTNGDGLAIDQVRDEVQARMSDQAGFLCHVDQLPEAVTQAGALAEAVRERGLACSRATMVVDVFRWRHLVQTSHAVLTALAHYAEHGGGSRGARAMIAGDGSAQVETVNGPVAGMTIRPERDEDKHHKLVLTQADQGFTIEERPLRTIEDLDTIFFEKNWAPFLTGTVYSDGFVH